MPTMTLSASAIAGGAVSARLSGTFVVTAELDDGFLFEDSGGMTSSANTVQRGDTPNSAAVGIVRFDTSSLPDNTVVTAAYLRLYITGVQGREGVWSIIGEYYNALGGTPPPQPVKITDWTDTPPAVPLFSVDQVSIPNFGWLNVPINSYDGVIANGYTAFRLHISQGQGTYATRGIFFAGFSSAESPEAQLVISYGTYALLTGAGHGAAATATANLEVGHLISGGAIGAATTTVSIMVIHRLSSQLTGAATATGSLRPNHAMIVGVAAGAAAPTGSLHVSHFLAGTTTGIAAVTAPLRVTPIHIAAAITATGRTVGRLLGTFGVTATDDDGFVYEEIPPVDGPFPEVFGPTLRVQREADNIACTVTLIRFDTSAIPDNAIITGAYLRLSITSLQNAGTSLPFWVWYVTGEYYSASNWPIDGADWTDTPPASPLFSVYQGDLNNAWLNGPGFYDIPLPSFSGISVTGYTGLRLQLQANPSYPTLTADFASGETATGPMLVVNFTTLKQLSGTAAGAAIVTGQLDKSSYLLTGSVTGRSLLSAALKITVHLSGTPAGLAVLHATLTVAAHDPIPIAGAVRGTGFTSAVITHIVHVDAVVTASATAVATPQVFKNMVGSLVGQALVTANLRISHVRMEGVITGQAVLTGSIRIAHRMQGFTIGTATAQATMGPVNHINGIVTGTAVSVVVLRHIVHARGLVYGQAYTSAVLMWVNIQTIHCEPLTGVHTAPGCTGLSPVATISSENLVTLHTIGK